MPVNKKTFIKSFQYLCLTFVFIIGLISIVATGGSGGEGGPDASDDDSATAADTAGVEILPRRIQFSDDGLRLVTGLGLPDDFYDFSTTDNSDIKRIDLIFSQADWWTQLTNNYQSETEIPATMTYYYSTTSTTLPSAVGVRFKGFTSYSMNTADPMTGYAGEKKSFNISMDYEDPTQNIDGFDNLNLNCAWQDNTFMREVIFEHVNQRYIPAVSNNYVELYINGEYWGIYINSQQVDKNFIEEWFTSTNGTLWRAESSVGQAGGAFGAGTSALNYLGDTEDKYTPYYTLNSYYIDDPWSDLINVCYALEYTAIDDPDYEDKIGQVLDIDRALWCLVMENIFADEDSYVNKGGMDYFNYWDWTTGLLTPIEYDGNNTLMTEFGPGGMQGPPGRGGGPMPMSAGSLVLSQGPPPGGRDGGLPPDSGGLPPEDGFPDGGGMGENLLTWTPFQNADNAQYPLLYKLLNVPSIRQRYLAHMRTVLTESFNVNNMNAMIDAYAAKIGPYISKDPKTFITDFAAAVTTLKSAVATRCAVLWSNTELNVTGLTISDVSWQAGGVEWAMPSSSDEVTINATVIDPGTVGGIDSVYAYTGEGIEGIFTKVQMFDDGLNGDGAAGDGVFSVILDAKESGIRTRFYIEAVADNSAGTRTYYPAGAAHDVFTFRVE